MPQHNKIDCFLIYIGPPTTWEYKINSVDDNKSPFPLFRVQGMAKQMSNQGRRRFFLNQHESQKIN